MIRFVHSLKKVSFKVYFACNSPGLDDWVELPIVTPQQIIVSREMVKLFTGNLEAEVSKGISKLHS